MDDNLVELKHFLFSLTSGLVPDIVVPELKSFLEKTWHLIEGCNQEKMHAGRL